jgi:HD superfamily phosphohydrolase
LGNTSINKKKIVNDPVHGFINIQYSLLYDIIAHPFFQRLRRIMQLGLTYYVYPGAIHSRLQHAMGATHLMGLAIEVIRSKGHRITDEEAQSVCAAILLHDIGHGPFSHTLENLIIDDFNHEDISLAYMNYLNAEFGGKLDLALEIFTDKYSKKFLHQLVSSQLDMDRLDYLKRDSFFTGVSEGVVGSDRIIKMLNVVDDKLVVESKGIYSIEKFIIARRLMFWQVYLHKTAIVAEQILIKIFTRVLQLAELDSGLFASPALKYFIYRQSNDKDKLSTERLEKFALLDDYDILAAIKVWCEHPDFILSELSKRLINRDLFKIEIQYTPYSIKKKELVKEKVLSIYDVSEEDIDYFVISDEISVNTYSDDEKINILYKHGEQKDISDASDMLNHDVLSKSVKKYFLIYPKECIN